jgi:hypothetical protein
MSSARVTPRAREEADGAGTVEEIRDDCPMSDIVDARSSLRHLVASPLDCRFGSTAAMLTDISVTGIRLCHCGSLEPGMKQVVEFESPGGRVISFDAVVVWSHPLKNQVCGDRASGLKLFAEPEEVELVIRDLVRAGLTSSVGESRGANRFRIHRVLTARLGQREVTISDLSSGGARLDSSQRLEPGGGHEISFALPKSELTVTVSVEVVWSHLAAIWSETENRYTSGVRVVSNPAMLRAAIGHLSDLHYAEKDLRSLTVKSRIERLGIAAAPSGDLDGESGGRISLVRMVRRRLQHQDEDSVRWMVLAEESSRHPQIRGLAGPIAADMEALAVWEFLDRRVDPSLVVLGFR